MTVRSPTRTNNAFKLGSFEKGLQTCAQGLGKPQGASELAQIRPSEPDLEGETRVEEGT